MNAHSATSTLRDLPLLRVHLVREGRADTLGLDSITTPAEAARLLIPILRDRDRETVAVLLLDIKHRPLGVHIAHEGSLSECAVHPREVFKAALLANAAALILAHNHPSGDATPSLPDTALWHLLRKVGEMIGIEVLDHVVIGLTHAVSCREVDQLGTSPPYTTPKTILGRMT